MAIQTKQISVRSGFLLRLVSTLDLELKARINLRTYIKELLSAH